ncbi:YlbF family regulator [Persicirhabdus sediminis]|uniref:YlbF family regulator n=1 Tax=Persicirhabdus sediminis TaxID=454144 RepID=A0A8J7MEA3_9BACT|nr:YlbF family regulator [Persicirhabdus sediminis]MBK1791086.1 YlbF family regulator [Persicirhabdus sediminis]
MSTILEESAILGKTKELCEAIVTDEKFLYLQKQVETFLGDDAARLQYQSVHERGDDLNRKQQSGIELSEREIQEFEEARDQLLANSIASNFIQAQQELTEIQKTVGKYVGMTLELGRVPSEEDMANAGGGGGCCGGSGGGGCGC